MSNIQRYKVVMNIHMIVVILFVYYLIFRILSFTDNFRDNFRDKLEYIETKSFINVQFSLVTNRDRHMDLSEGFKQLTDSRDCLINT